jgi:leader peptidase (prepilin peptidase)/N-methyltransferase
LVDLEQMWLPEPLCRWGLACGLAVTALVGGLQGSASGSRLLLEHLLAVALGLLGFEATTALAFRLFGRPALGLGDAKLAAMIGAWLGPLGLGLAVAVAVISGALVGLLGRLSGRLSRHQAIPFGPFLVLGTLGLWAGTGLNSASSARISQSRWAAGESRCWPSGWPLSRRRR